MMEHVKIKFSMEIKEMDGDFSKSELKDLTKSTSNSKQYSKYPALRTLSGIFSFIGYLLIAIGFVLLYLSYETEGVIYGILALIVCVLISLILFAFSNLIYLFIDIEKNTRGEK